MGHHLATVSRHQTVSPAPRRRADVGSRVEKAGGEDPAAPSGGRGPLESRVASSHRQREAGPRAVRGPARPAARGLRTPGRSPRDPEASTASATPCCLPARPGPQAPRPSAGCCPHAAWVTWSLWKLKRCLIGSECVSGRPTAPPPAEAKRRRGPLRASRSTKQRSVTDHKQQGRSHTDLVLCPWLRDLGNVT